MAITEHITIVYKQLKRFIIGILFGKKAGKQIENHVMINMIKKKNEILIGSVILLVGIIALLFDNPLTATLCVPIGVSLLIFSKII